MAEGSRSGFRPTGVLVGATGLPVGIHFSIHAGDYRVSEATAPVSMTALLVTLVFIFAFQADNITGKFLHVLLIAVPILIQVYFNSSLAYGLMKLLGVQYSVAAPGALIGASNFFELAVATAIALFGPGYRAALATVVGVLIEVPVMLSVCAVCNRTRGWFPVTDVS